MIVLQNLSKTYTPKGGSVVSAVREVGLTVERGEFVVITGRSGSGKTTLLNLIGGLTRPSAGEVLVAGTNFWELPDREQSLLRSRKMGFIFQFPSLLPSLTILENVILPATFNAPDGSERPAERATHLLDMLGLSKKRQAYPRQLSAGQQQRAVIARSLISQPAILLADEPTSNLDEQTEREIIDLFRQIHAQTGVTIVLVTHSSHLVRNGSRAFEMAGGTLRAAGSKQPGDGG